MAAGTSVRSSPSCRRWSSVGSDVEPSMPPPALPTRKPRFFRKASKSKLPCPKSNPTPNFFFSGSSPLVAESRAARSGAGRRGDGVAVLDRGLDLLERRIGLAERGLGVLHLVAEHLEFLERVEAGLAVRVADLDVRLARDGEAAARRLLAVDHQRGLVLAREDHRPVVSAAAEETPAGTGCGLGGRRRQLLDPEVPHRRVDSGAQPALGRVAE